MFEQEKKIGTTKDFCPICREKHEFDTMQLTVYTKLSGVPVKYIEIFDKCPRTHYQVERTKTLETFSDTKKGE